MDICEKFGANVRRVRRDKDISQEELAYRAGIHRTYLVSMEQRGGRNPTLKVMEKIAQGLGVPLSNLFE